MPVSQLNSIRQRLETYRLLLGKIAGGPQDDNDSVVLELNGPSPTTAVSKMYSSM